MDASDVTFTRVEFTTLNPFYEYLMVLTRCSRCRIENLLVNDVIIGDGAYSVLKVDGGSVTIQDAVWSNWQSTAVDVNGDTVYPTGTAIQATNGADVSLVRNRFSGLLLGNTPGTVVVEGGSSLSATSCSWSDISMRPETAGSSAAVSISGGGALDLANCTFDGVVGSGNALAATGASHCSIRRLLPFFLPLSCARHCL